MNLADVIEELRAAVDTIPGLRVPPWGAPSISPPAALVMPPERVSFDETYGRGLDAYPDIEVLVLVANPTTWRAFEQLAPFVAGDGPKSIKAAIEAYPFTACDAGSVRVASVEFTDAKYADVPYLAAIFHVGLMGPGAEE